MKKSDYSFDLRNFLVENKLTESGRTEEGKRYHFKKTLLNEMAIPVNGDDEEFDDEFDAESAAELGQNDIEECDPDMGAGNPLEEWGNKNRDAIDPKKDPLYRELCSYQSKYGEARGIKIFKHFHPELSDKELNTIIPGYARQNAKVGAGQDQKRLNNVTTFDQQDRSEDRPTYDKYGNRTGNMMLDPVHKSMEEALDEAGYTDYEYDDDFASDDLDLTVGDNFASNIGKGKAQKTFQRTTDTNFDAPDDEPEFDSPEDLPDDDAEPMSEPATPSGEAPAENIASQLKYNPETVEFEMSDEELNQFLYDLNPKNPQRPLRVLQRALNVAQDEVNEGVMKRLYLILDRGFYKTVSFRRGNVIATIYRNTEFGAEELEEGLFGKSKEQKRVENEKMLKGLKAAYKAKKEMRGGGGLWDVDKDDMNKATSMLDPAAKPYMDWDIKDIIHMIKDLEAD